jgi:Tol biopolymer transport system component
LTAPLALILSMSLACNFITSQSPASVTKAADTPERGATSAPIKLPDATNTPAPRPTIKPTTVRANKAGRIVFVSCKSQNSLGMGTECGIKIVNADGSGLRQLTSLDNDASPALSPDGLQVAFTSLRRNGNNEIYLINTDKSGLNRLTTNKGDDVAPAWSPDGSQIAYVSGPFETGAHLNVFVMGVDGSHPRPLTNYKNANALSPRWSPDGSRIVFVLIKNHVFSLNVMNTDGSNVREIETAQATELGSPTWSPDGKKLIFTMRGDGRSLQGNPQLYIINVVDGSDLHKLNTSCTYCYGAEWGH